MGSGVNAEYMGTSHRAVQLSGPRSSIISEKS